MKKILFICLGNICRSVAAEGMLKSMVHAAGLDAEFEIDSAGLIDYHEGELADPRMRSAAWRRGIKLTHRSRPVTAEDFEHFDMIVAMDADNVKRLNRICPQGCRQKIVEASSFFSERWGYDCVPDPYYSPDSAFDFCLDQLDDVCRGILKDHGDEIAGHRENKGKGYTRM